MAQQVTRLVQKLQLAMLADVDFKELCEEYGLPWDPQTGYEPRWYNGPDPEQVKVLVVMAEPAPITPSEASSLLPAVNHDDWFTGYDLNLQEHYWRGNLELFCNGIWPNDTRDHMRKYLAGTCAFWMSLPHGSATKDIPARLLRFFEQIYLRPLMAHFDQAVVVAAGRKASDRLKRIGVDHIHCSAFTLPESNKPRAKKSWADQSVVTRALLNGQ